MTDQGGKKGGKKGTKEVIKKGKIRFDDTVQETAEALDTKWYLQIKRQKLYAVTDVTSGIYCTKCVNITDEACNFLTSCSVCMSRSSAAPSSPS